MLYFGHILLMMPFIDYLCTKWWILQTGYFLFSQGDFIVLLLFFKLLLHVFIERNLESFFKANSRYTLSFPLESTLEEYWGWNLGKFINILRINLRTYSFCSIVLDFCIVAVCEHVTSTRWTRKVLTVPRFKLNLGSAFCVDKQLMLFLRADD